MPWTNGRYANKRLAAGIPDPITKLTWDNAALMSPAFAKKLGVLTGDLVQIRINERAAASPSNASWLSRRSYPGPCRDSVTVSLGYGRKMPEFNALPYAGGGLRRAAEDCRAGRF